MPQMNHRYPVPYDTGISCAALQAENSTIGLAVVATVETVAAYRDGQGVQANVCL